MSKTRHKRINQAFQNKSVEIECVFVQSVKETHHLILEVEFFQMEPGTKKTNNICQIFTYIIRTVTKGGEKCPAVVTFKVNFRFLPYLGQVIYVVMHTKMMHSLFYNSITFSETFKFVF